MSVDRAHRPLDWTEDPGDHHVNGPEVL